MTDVTTVELTAPEIQVLMCAMAGNFPQSLSDVRMPVLRKLARADLAASYLPGGRLSRGESTGGSSEPRKETE